MAASLAALRSAATNPLAVFDARAHQGVDRACQGPGAFRGQRSAPDLASMLGDNVAGKGCHLYLWLLRGPVVPERSVTRSIDLDANICARHANPAGLVNTAGETARSRGERALRMSTGGSLPSRIFTWRSRASGTPRWRQARPIGVPRSASRLNLKRKASFTARSLARCKRSPTSSTADARTWCC